MSMLESERIHGKYTATSEYIKCNFHTHTKYLVYYIPTIREKMNE